jgi:hypothetical protein
MEIFMDLEKLTPAPWRVRQSESSSKWILADANDEYIATFEIKEAAEQCALANNAFDVMMRRQWCAYPYWTPSKKRLWKVCFAGCDTVLLNKMPKLNDDPFTAIVEADRWYRENIEGETDE